MASSPTSCWLIRSCWAASPESCMLQVWHILQLTPVIPPSQGHALHALPLLLHVITGTQFVSCVIALVTIPGEIYKRMTLCAPWRQTSNTIRNVLFRASYSAQYLSYQTGPLIIFLKGNFMLSVPEQLYDCESNNFCSFIIGIYQIHCTYDRRLLR